MLLLLLFAGFTLHAHWNAFIQWCLATQITLHRYLVMYLLQLNNHQYSAGLWLITGALLYGVLHAIGPGHGKFIVTTYLSTNKESELAARVVPFLGSLMQGVSAVLFVFILAMGFKPRLGRYQHQPLVCREDKRGADWRIRCVCHLPGTEKPAPAQNDHSGH
ncbi:high-affinity nickel-transporter [Enterobacter cancerogenus]|uniref:Nickel/cobalt efflux system n=1 Tax=Enterobacter cancerogenus TaxID=69218 RepID=A0A484XUJ6_9ENTR|nr:high-affinity nickel-transporter [Enterobacter cancerogenus]